MSAGRLPNFLHAVRAAVPALAVIIAVGVLAGVGVRLIGTSRRWEWWLWSPNDLGAFAAAILALLMGCAAAWLKRDDGRWRLWLFAALGAPAFIVLMGLVGSCSRGGWCAFLVACLVFAAATSGASRRLALGAMLSGIIAISLVPRAHGRLAVVDARGLDGSIDCRLEAWSATTAMVADKPAGWGTGQFGELCDSWYLSQYRGERIWQPFNDTLLIAAEHGIVMAWLFLACGLTLMIGLLWRARQDGPMQAGVGSAVAALLTAGAFSCLLRPYGMRWYLAGFAVIGAVTLLRPGWSRRRLGYVGAAGALLSAVVLAGVWGKGMLVVESLPWRPLSPNMAVPRHAPARATVIVVRSSADTDDAICRMVLRPLVAAGMGACVVTADRLVATMTTLPPHSGAIVVLALRDCGPDVAAMLSTADLPLIAAAIFLDWDGSGTARTLTCPILALAGSAAPTLPVPMLDALRATHSVSAQRQASIPLCWPRHFSQLSDGIAAWVETVVSDSSAHDGNQGSSVR